MIYTFGKTLNNRYIFIDQINSGAFSIIYLIYDYVKNNYFIAKVLNEDNKETGENEIKILEKLNNSFNDKNKNIKAHLLLNEEIIKTKEDIIIIEDLQSLTLYNLINNYYLSVDDKNFIYKSINQQLKPVLDYLKNIKILHTDIKPENIFLKVPGFHMDIKNKDIILKFIDEIQNLRCKVKQRNKEVNKIIKKYKEKLLTLELENYTDEIDEYYEDNEDYDILTDSDIISDSENEDGINDFLNDKIEEYTHKPENKQNNKKILDFNLMNIKYSIGDFGNAIDYSEPENYNKIINGQYHDLQTRYYRHPNIIMRSANIFNTDYFAFYLTLEEIKKESPIFNPLKYKGITTDHEHLNLLIQSDEKYKYSRGRKTDYFFNFDKLMNNYFLGK